MSSLLQFGPIAIFATAVSVVTYGAQRAVIWEETLKRQRTEQEMQLTLSSTRALLFPIMASAALLLMFYFFSAFSIVMYFSAAFGSFSGIYFTLVPLLDMLSPSLAKRTINIPYSIQTVTVQQAILGTVAGLSVAIWMLTGSFFLNNILGIGYSVLALGFVKVPNLKISVLILTLLFIYDIFWVFYSANFFGTSVMVAVATKAATNPLHTVAGAVGLQDNVAAELQLPMKLIFGDHILGLGDIVLPGLILVFLLKYDTFKGYEDGLQGYFMTGLGGYSAGLLFAMWMAFSFHVAQPALLYLVPGVLVPILWKAMRAGELRQLWQGVPEEETYGGRNLDV